MDYWELFTCSLGQPGGMSTIGSWSCVRDFWWVGKIYKSEMNVGPRKENREVKKIIPGSDNAAWNSGSMWASSSRSWSVSDTIFMIMSNYRQSDFDLVQGGRVIEKDRAHSLISSIISRLIGPWNQSFFGPKLHIYMLKLVASTSNFCLLVKWNMKVVK